MNLSQDALVELLPKALGLPLERPSSIDFKSWDGHPCVKCHVNTNDGLLFFMPSGLAFVDKPATFISCSSITKIDIFATMKYIELEVTLQGITGEKTISFSMIDGREE